MGSVGCGDGDVLAVAAAAAVLLLAAAEARMLLRGRQAAATPLRTTAEDAVNLDRCQRRAWSGDRGRGAAEPFRSGLPAGLKQTGAGEGGDARAGRRTDVGGAKRAAGAATKGRHHANVKRQKLK